MNSVSTPAGVFDALCGHGRIGPFAKACLAVLVSALSSPAVHSQTIVLDGWQREIQARLTAQNNLLQSYDSGYVYTNLTDVTPGPYQQTNSFAVSGVALADGNLGVGHDTSVSVSPTSLVITGAVSVSKYVMQINPNDGTFGGAGALGQSHASFRFNVYQPCNFTLVASTVHSPYKSPATGGNACESIVELSGGVQNGFTIDTGFGQTYPQAITPITFPDSGTTTGVLQPGGYTLMVDAQDSSTLDPSLKTDSYTANRSVTFSLTVTPQPQAPTDLALAAGTNTFQFTWTAPQDGIYRVLSSTNLVDWGEYLSPTNLPAGPVTNTINAPAGSSRGFFRVEALQ